MTEKAIQDYYRGKYAVCYGCGHQNPHGLQIKSFWEAEEVVCRYRPQPYHTAVPGYTYGGLLASLIDCHATGTAAAFMYRQENRPMDSDPPFRFVTGSLNVRFEAPTPIDTLLELRARVQEIRGRKVNVHVSVIADQITTVRAEVTVFQIPEGMEIFE
jgi:acyl-coenzyme A thioesterase PaaI-like protein